MRKLYSMFYKNVYTKGDIYKNISYEKSKKNIKFIENYRNHRNRTKKYVKKIAIYREKLKVTVTVTFFKKSP